MVEARRGENSRTGRQPRASLLGFLALGWMAWMTAGVLRGLAAQRYLELEFTFLAMIAVRDALLSRLPYLLAGVPLTLYGLRLLRRERAFVPVLLAMILGALVALHLTELNALLHPALRPRWGRALVLLAGLGLALAAGAGVGFLLGHARPIGRAAARAARAIDSFARRLAPTLPARLLGQRAYGAVAVIATGGLLVLPGFISPHPSDAPAVIILLVDTLRADHLGCYGYSRATSPSIDRWAAGATLFESAIAQASWTKPSVASLFTSLYPSAHRTGSGLHERRMIRGHRIEMVPAPEASPRTRAGLAPELVTLAEVFRNAGYRTAGYSSNNLVSWEFGYQQGFEELRNFPPRAGSAADRAVSEHGCRWIRAHADEPFLLYLHFMAPHAPYDPPAGFDRFTTGRETIDIHGSATKDSINHTGTLSLSPQHVQELINQYDGEILFIDSLIQEVLATLDEAGLTHRSVVVLTADHGEEFLDHGYVWHESRHLYDELTRVPLIVAAPGLAGAGPRIDEAVMLIDVAPTLFALAGLPGPPGIQGRTLVPLALLPARHASRSRLAYAEALDWGWLQAVWSDSLKLIRDCESGTSELYDRRRDPREQHALRGFAAQAALADSLDRVLPRGTDPDPDDMRGAEGKLAGIRERLRSLGYVQ